MAYKFQFGTARLSGALEQEGDITIATGSGADVIGVESTLGSGQYLAQLGYDGATDTGKLEIADGSTGGTVFSVLDILSGSAMDTLAGAALDFDQSTGVMDVTNTGVAGLISEDVIAVANDSIVYYDSTGVLQRDSLADYATAIADAGLTATSGQIAVVNATNGGLQINSADMQLDLNDLAAAAIDVANDSFAILDATDSSTKKESIADLATAMVAGNNGLSATNGVFSVEVSGAVRLDGDKVGISGSIAGAGLSFGGGVDAIATLAVDATELADIFTAAVIDNSADSIIFIDANDSNAMKQESVADFAVKLADGTNGLAASGGRLAIDISEYTAVTPAASDTFLTLDSDGSTEQLTTTDALATLFAGNGLSAASAVLAVEVSGAVVIDSDAVGISGSIAGAGLAYAGGVNSISTLSVDLNEFASAAVDVAADSLVFIDANGDVSRQDTFADYATAAAGNGLAASSGQFALDLNELTDTAIDVANDSIAFVDAGDNGSKKESIADLVSAMAGAGLAASSGVLSVQSNNVALKANGDTLVEGFNYFANASSDATVTMPAAPDVGDVVRIKAGNLTSGANIIIDRAGSHLIDGETSVRIESPYGAISMVYVATNDWRLF